MTRPDYGMEAPALVQLMAGLGASGVVAGVVLLRVEPHWVGPLVAALGLLALGAAAALIVYARSGRFRVRDAMLALVDWRGGERVLVLAAGRGLVTVAAARHPGSRVTAADRWTGDEEGNARADAAQLLAAEGVSAELVDGALPALPVAPAAFEVVLGHGAWHRLGEGEAAAAAAELARVLAPRGTLVLADHAGLGAAARALAAAGLSVDPLRPAWAVARAPMALLRARKPG